MKTRRIFDIEITEKVENYTRYYNSVNHSTVALYHQNYINYEDPFGNIMVNHPCVMTILGVKYELKKMYDQFRFTPESVLTMLLTSAIQEVILKTFYE